MVKQKKLFSNQLNHYMFFQILEKQMQELVSICNESLLSLDIKDRKKRLVVCQYLLFLVTILVINFEWELFNLLGSTRQVMLKIMTISFIYLLYIYLI
jgi:hypothetical protein